MFNILSKLFSKNSNRSSAHESLSEETPQHISKANLLYTVVKNNQNTNIARYLYLPEVNKKNRKYIFDTLFLCKFLSTIISMEHKKLILQVLNDTIKRIELSNFIKLPIHTKNLVSKDTLINIQKDCKKDNFESLITLISEVQNNVNKDAFYKSVRNELEEM